jgi:aldehyde:ferredoxin oxidoreductase
VAEGQAGKALVDSLGLCDFFTGDITSDLFLSLYEAATGIAYTAEELKAAGRRIYALERSLNNRQGRDRTYDAFVPPKLTVPLSRGGHRGQAVDPALYATILDHYYKIQGWSADGRVAG